MAVGHARSPEGARVGAGSMRPRAVVAGAGGGLPAQLGLGVPPHIVRDIVGHAHIGVTMEIYAHAALAEKLRRAGQAG